MISKKKSQELREPRRQRGKRGAQEQERHRLPQEMRIALDLWEAWVCHLSSDRW